MRPLIPGLVCASLVVSSVLAQQVPTPPGQPEVTFKAEVDYVDVDTSVTDQQGNFVKGLTKDDFELLEDGKPQKIEMFSYVDLPLGGIERLDRFGFANRAVTNDVKTNEQSLAGRLYVIVLDDLDTSLFRTSTVRRTAQEFIARHLGANDVAAVVYTSGRTDASQEFTSDQALLLAAVQKFVGRKLRSATLDKVDTYFHQREIGVLAAAGRDPNGPAPATNNGSESSGSSTDPSLNPYTRGDGYPDRTFDSEDMERGFRALQVLHQVKSLAEFMANVHGRRKALLLFSEGIDYETNNIFGADSATAVVRAMQDAVTAAARANVSVFGIDPRGLVGMSPDMIDMASPGVIDDAAAASVNFSGMASEIRLSQDSLKSISEETGGFASVGNDPSGAFDRIVRANSTYYVLGYYPPSHPRDGKFHKIDVRVKRPGLRVFARKGYADPRGKTPEERAADERDRLARQARNGAADTTTAELRAVLNSPMQQGGISMLVQAAPFKTLTKDTTVALAIEVDSARFRFEPRNNGAVFADKLELSYFSLNEQGKPLGGERRELELALRPESFKRAQQAGMRINERLALPPGRYQLRIGVRESGASALGTVFYDIDIPDFSREPLSMSGLLLTASTSTIVPGLIADKTIAPEQLPGPATSRRTFAQGDEISLYTEIYSNLPAAQNNAIGITTRLVAEDGREIFASRETTAGAKQAAGGTSTFGVARRLPLKDVTPGRYLLRVEAQSPGNPKDAKTASRETVITVIPAPR